MVSAIYRYYLFILVPVFWFPDGAEGYRNVTVGDSLVANDENITWTSPSGDFAFGFVPYLGVEQQFLLAIWFNKIRDKTVVWSANIDRPAGRESRVQLSPNGKLVLSSPDGLELWSSDGVISSKGTESLHASMLDTGNFVVASGNSSIIWESFRNPTDTILPTQELGVDTNLTSLLREGRYGSGAFQLRFSNGVLGLNQVDRFSGKPFRPYYNISDGSRLIFNQSGYIMVMKSNGIMLTLAPLNAAPSADSYYRARLSYDGVFTLYSHPKASISDESWSVLWPVPDNICGLFVQLETRRGTGPCGYNSICESDQNNRPTCSCPPGFSFLDEADPHAGCKPDYEESQDCNPDGTVVQADRFEFRTGQFLDWPFGDYSTLLSVSEAECRQSCLLDCSCIVAILLDPVFNNGSGTCWKKKLPLLNGRLNRNDSTLNRKVLIKVLKSNDSAVKLPNSKNSRGNQNVVILILAVLLGTSAFLNFFSLAAIVLVLFCLYQRKMRDLNKRPSRRELEMNLRCFSYKELEFSTRGFKEELGRGAFGTVYKGMISSSYGNFVAVKKLDKFVQEGEREFKTEVNVIGQTHHKNLVRLLGYCDEGEHRLLVYELMHNGSLSSFLFGKLRPGWDQRMQIALGIAKGLTYLHDECSTQIIHCDIKPQNILLDDSFTAKISDFGLAKLLINNKTRTLTGIRGTKGYVAPEWFRNTPVTVKVDVYSFGVMLLEIVSCRKCVEFELEEEAILTEWAYDCYRERMLERLVENDEEARSDMKRVETFVKIAIWCVQEDAMMRPSMRTVSMMLEGVTQVPNPPNPFPFSSMS